MARLSRLAVPGHAHHVILRGNNRQPVFSADADYLFMQGLLAQAAHTAGVAIHGYVLMENHFHLLATPGTEDALARMMQDIGRAYVRYFNARTGRFGSLWEGRYRSALLQAETYLLACMVYLDQNPVRAALVDSAAQYPWSSHGHYIGRGLDRIITPHPVHWSLGNTPFAREQAYAQLVAEGLSVESVQALTHSGLHGWALGEAQFLAALQKLTPRRLTQARPGRPRRAIA